MNIPISKRLGIYLGDRRRAVGLSQIEVSKVLGYPNQQSVANWERGVAFPPVKKFKKLIKVYQISKDEFMSVILTEIEQALESFF